MINNPYHILELENDCSISVNIIKKQFLKLVLEHHPDRGGDKKKMDDIIAAYKVLSDEKKREKYHNSFSKTVDELREESKNVLEQQEIETDMEIVDIKVKDIHKNFSMADDDKIWFENKIKNSEGINNYDINYDINKKMEVSELDKEWLREIMKVLDNPKKKNNLPKMEEMEKIEYQNMEVFNKIFENLKNKCHDVIEYKQPVPLYTGTLIEVEDINGQTSSNLFGKNLQYSRYANVYEENVHSNPSNKDISNILEEINKDISNKTEDVETNIKNVEEIIEKYNTDLELYLHMMDDQFLENMNERHDRF